jgi:RHS repeat-associated protein
MTTNNHSNETLTPTFDDASSQHHENQPNQENTMSKDNNEAVQLQNSTAIEVTPRGGDTAPDAATDSIQSIAPPIDKDDITRGKFEYPVGPGLKSVAPAEAAVIIESRKIDGSNIYRPSAHQALMPALSQGQVTALVGQASNTVQSPASIAELARALRNDVDKIFYHVYNNIEFHPNYGLAKGSLGCLIDGVGNAWDQSNLLVDLLRTAGYTANLVFGQIELTTAELTAWLGTDISGAYNAANFLSTSGIPNQLNGTFPAQTLQMSHCWVQVDIGGTLYMLDPSYKAYTTTAASINLTTATSYSQATLLTQAQVGATVDGSGNWIQNVNKANIATELNTLSTNLVNYIKTNNPTATLDDVLGGRSINQISTPVRLTALPYQKVGDVPVIWTVIPDVYKTTVRVQFPGIDVTFFSNDIYHKRLTIFFDGLIQPVLALDGVTVATGTAQGLGSYNYAQVTITHPYAVTWYNQTAWMLIKSPSGTGTSYYLLGTSFGPTKKGMVDFHQKALEVNTFAGGASTSEPILGEQLAVVWNTYAGEFMGVADLVNRQTNTWTVNHHIAGLAVNETYLTPSTYLLDVPGIVTPTSPLAGDYAASAKAQNAINMHAYTLEQVALEQVVGSPSTSTTRVLDVANANGTKIYKGTNANFVGSVRPNLTLYTTPELDNIQNGFLPNGYFCLIPETKNQQFNHFSGGGYALIHPNGYFVGVISGVYFGGQSGPGVPPKPPKKKKDPCEEGDPVNLNSGSYFYRQTDLTIGSGKYPYSLSFGVNYDSVSRYSDSALGLGWRHTWQRGVTVSSDAFRGLGSDSPVDAVASIVGTFVALDLLADTAYPITKMMTVSLGLSWWSDQMSNNVASVELAEQVLAFSKLPDGTYHAPREDASVLALIGGLFKHTSTHKVVSNFDALNNLSTIVYPYGVTITLAYTAGVLTSITNGLGRTLTLNYTGARLTSVTDGTGRSVGYSTDVNNQLSSIMDAIGNSVTFQYDQPGRFWKYFKPQNPANACVINTYDTLDRIQSQLDIMGHTRTFYFAGWRSEFVDPVGNSSIYFFNRQSEKIADQDALGNVMNYTRDGLGRIKRVTQSEGNYEDFTFDTSNNVLTVTKVAKSGSGLANIQLVNTYNLLWNKVATAQDGNGNITTYSYDPVTSNLLTIQRPAVGGLTPTVTKAWNNRGQLLTNTDETGMVTQMTYDIATEKLTSVVVDFGASPHLNLTANIGYDAVGNTVSEQDRRGNTTTYLVDNLRRVTQKTDCAPFGYVTQYSYDANSNLLTLKRETGIPLTPWQTYTWTYSLSDKKASLIDPATNISSWFYDGADRLQSTQDAENRVYQYSYDILSRVTTVTDPTSVVSETRGYSANGKLTSAKDARNFITNFSYDGFDRLDKTTYPDSSFEQNQVYDANGNVLTYRTRSSNTIVRTFDVLNRISTKAPQGQATVTYTYDLANRLLSAGKPVVVGDPSTGLFQQLYDTAGRFYQSIDPDLKAVTRVLDANDNITKIIYPDGYFVDRAYDELNRTSTIKLNGSATAAATFGYDQLSRRTSLTLSSGASVAYTHQLNEDLTGLVNTFVGSSLALTYGFNKVHQITSDLLSDGTYTWHPASPGSVSYTTANNVNEYPQVGAASFSYNTNACLIGDGIWTHGYDTENHLLASAKSGTSLTYVYDPFHRQIQKTVTTGSTVKTRYVYSGWHRMADYDGVSGTLQNRYVYGETFDEPLIQVTGAGALTFLHANHQGTIVATTNSSGTVTNKIVTGPFGETITIGDTTFGYNGQRYDSETGLYYYKNRYYSPTLGRFLQPDPIGYQIDEECGCACPGGCDDASTPSTLNLYTYVDNDPLNQTDPLGLQVATMAGTAVAPGPGTAVGIAIDVGIALGLGALAIGIGQAAADAAEPYWRRLKRKICEANAFGNLNNCLDEAATFPCPEDAAQYRDICWRLWEAQVAKC